MKKRSGFNKEKIIYLGSFSVCLKTFFVSGNCLKVKLKELSVLKVNCFGIMEFIIHCIITNNLHSALTRSRNQFTKLFVLKQPGTHVGESLRSFAKLLPGSSQSRLVLTRVLS